MRWRYSGNVQCVRMCACVWCGGRFALVPTTVQSTARTPVLTEHVTPAQPASAYSHARSAPNQPAQVPIQEAAGTKLAPRWGH